MRAQGTLTGQGSRLCPTEGSSLTSPSTAWPGSPDEHSHIHYPLLPSRSLVTVQTPVHRGLVKQAMLQLYMECSADSKKRRDYPTPPRQAPGDGTLTFSPSLAVCPAQSPRWPFLSLLTSECRRAGVRAGVSPHSLSALALWCSSGPGFKPSSEDTHISIAIPNLSCA